MINWLTNPKYLETSMRKKSLLKNRLLNYYILKIIWFVIFGLNIFYCSATMIFVVAISCPFSNNRR